MTKRVQNGDLRHEVRSVATGDGGHRVSVDGQSFHVAHGARRGGLRTFFVDGQVVHVAPGEPSSLHGHSTELSLERDTGTGLGAGRKQRAVDGVLKSPMPGRVLRVSAKVGDRVDPTTEVVVVEAMKMENQLFAPCAGRVETVWVSPGQTVEAQADLVRVIPE